MINHDKEFHNVLQIYVNTLLQVMESHKKRFSVRGLFLRFYLLRSHLISFSSPSSPDERFYSRAYKLYIYIDINNNEQDEENTHKLLFNKFHTYIWIARTFLQIHTRTASFGRRKLLESVP